MLERNKIYMRCLVLMAADIKYKEHTACEVRYLEKTTMSVTQNVVPGFSTPNTYGCVRIYPLPPPPDPPSFRQVYVRLTSPLRVQPACGLHQNSVSAGSPKFRPENACWDRSPSAGGVVPLMEIGFGFSPTPPGRYLGFCDSSVWYVHFISLIVRIVSISVWLLPLMYI
jgi:hypothetical protein